MVLVSHFNLAVGNKKKRNFGVDPLSSYSWRLGGLLKVRIIKSEKPYEHGYDYECARDNTATVCSEISLGCGL
jgi:hypothetical protein